MINALVMDEHQTQHVVTCLAASAQQQQQPIMASYSQLGIPLTRPGQRPTSNSTLIFSSALITIYYADNQFTIAAAEHPFPGSEEKIINKRVRKSPQLIHEEHRTYS